ncbi:MAG: hypothetical protein WC455_18475 [Dehalococcoidia bacterium]|jgi:hypothetical protein
MSKLEKSQRKIDLESNVVLTMKCLVWYSVGFGWTDTMISGIIGISVRESQKALARLVKVGHAETRNRKGIRHWWATEDGKTWLEEIGVNNLPISDGVAAFREEALTGLVEAPGKVGLKSEESLLRYAALPTAEWRGLRLQKEERFADSTLDEGYGICPGIPGDVKRHIGKFHKGQSRCIECRKRMRKLNLKSKGLI